MAVRNLLTLIPINAVVLEGLEIFAHPGLGSGASGDPTPSTDAPDVVLEKLFSTKSISPTKLLYNLEVCGNNNETIILYNTCTFIILYSVY